MSSVVAAIVSARLATLHELQTVYGLEDAYDLLEILAVQNYNHVVMTLPRGGAR